MRNRVLLSLLLPCLLSLGARLGAQDKVEHILDADFSHGLAISLLDPQKVISGGDFGATNPDTLRFGRPYVGPPYWQICQWFSKYDISTAQPETTRYGTSYVNEGKSISLTDDGVITLEVKTSNEYDAPRVADQNWVHLLLLQRFLPSIALKDVETLTLGFSLRIDYYKNCLGPEEFNPLLHTAHSPFYFLMTNTNPETPEYKQGLWLGLHSFDYRYSRLWNESHYMLDPGTQIYISDMPPRKVWGDIDFKDLEWHSFSVDLVPYLEEVFDYLHDKNLFTGSTFRDMTILEMNFGWESPGTFDAAVQMKGMSLVSTELKK